MLFSLAFHFLLLNIIKEEANKSAATQGYFFTITAELTNYGDVIEDGTFESIPMLVDCDTILNDISTSNLTGLLIHFDFTNIDGNEEVLGV